MLNRIYTAIATVVSKVINFLNYPWFKAPTAEEIDAYQAELSKDWKPTPSLASRISQYFDLQSERRNGSA